MSDVNVWFAISQQGLDAFKARRTAERNGTVYSGPMDDDTFEVLSKMHDQDVVAGMFKKPTIGGKVYSTFSVYLPGTARVQKAINDLTTKWPGHFIVVGAWWLDGRQAGTQFTYDEDGNVTVVTGTPAYPIPANAWRIMPDQYTYNPDGTVATTVPATSNAQLRDINLLSGQSPRRFT